MALTSADRIKETWTGTGTGTMTLAGAVTAFRTFADIGNANTCHYLITAVDGDGLDTGEWEVGFGAYTLSGTTLARGTVFSNSLGTQAKISFSAGTKHVSNVHDALNGRLVGAKVRLAVNFDIPNGISTTVDFDTGDHELWDTDGFHEGITNPERFTIPTGFDGTYKLVFFGNWSVSSAGVRAFIFRQKDSGDTQVDASQQRMNPPPTSAPSHTLTEICRAEGGDYFYLQVHQNSGDPEPLRGNADSSLPYTSFSITRIGN